MMSINASLKKLHLWQSLKHRFDEINEDKLLDADKGTSVGKT